MSDFANTSRVWKAGIAKEITFIVTKDCQLGCRYCYEVGKNAHERMSWDTARKVVDYILTNEHDEQFDHPSVIFAFIGGEPFLEIDLIDRICDYLKMQMYLRNHHWFNSYRFSITTNGINYHSPKVQHFIEKNKKHLSLTITIDGTKQKHDMNRLWRDNGKGERRGSYDDVVKNIPLWLQQFPEAATKVTVSSQDLPYVCESVMHIYSLGIKNVYINCVYENVWKDGDDILLEKQLKQLADRIIDGNLYNSFFCSFFDRTIGHPIDSRQNINWCGAGKTLAVDAAGLFYPCIRFAKFSLREKSSIIVGNVTDGLNRNLLRPFEWLQRDLQSTKECFECKVASGCAWCQAENYDCADSPTIFQRSMAMCKMHKARVRANNYYWEKLDRKLGKVPIFMSSVNSSCSIDKTVEPLQIIVVLLSESSVSYCIHHPSKDKYGLISFEDLSRIIVKAQKEGLDLCFVYPKEELPSHYRQLIDTVKHISIVPIESVFPGNVIVIDGWGDIERATVAEACYVFRSTLGDFYKKVTELKPLLKLASQLSVVFTDEMEFEKKDVNLYETALNVLKDLVLKEFANGHQIKLNLLTYRLFLDEMSNCDAGWKSVTLAPNGKYYVCPAFYYDDENNSCGNLNEGLDLKNPLLYKLNHAPLCRNCNAFHCQRCVFLNKKKTGEFNIPSFEQCEKSRIELKVTKEFFNQWNSIRSL